MNQREEAALDLLMEAERKAARMENDRLSDPDDDIEASMDMYEFDKRQKKKSSKPKEPNPDESDSEDEVNFLRKSRPQTASSALRLSRVLDGNDLRRADPPVKEPPKPKGAYNAKIQAIQIPKLPAQNFKEDEEFFREIEEREKEKEQSKKSQEPKEKALKLQDFIKMDEKTKEKKFKELLNSNKETNLVLQREKSTIADLENALKRLENEEKALSSHSSAKTPNAVWLQKIAMVEAKQQEEETKLSNSKITLNKMARVLSSECGDFTSIDDLLKDEKALKERAQRIELLKSRIRDLKETQKRGSTPMPGNSLAETQGTMKKPNRGVKTTKSIVGGERKKEMEDVKAENESIKEKIEKTEEKIGKLEGKTKFLQEEIKEIKGEFEAKKREKMDQSGENDNSIKKLKEEIVKMQGEKEKMEKMEPQIITKFVFKQQEPISGGNMPMDSLEIMQMKEKLERMRSIAKDKDAQINNLISASQREENASYGLRNTPSSKNQFFITNPSMGASQMVARVHWALLL